MNRSISRDDMSGVTDTNVLTTTTQATQNDADDPLKKIPCFMISPHNKYKKRFDKFIALFIVNYGLIDRLTLF